MAVTILVMVMSVVAALAVLGFVTAGHLIRRSPWMRQRLRRAFFTAAALSAAVERRVAWAIRELDARLYPVGVRLVEPLKAAVLRDVVREPGQTLLRR